MSKKIVPKIVLSTPSSPFALGKVSSKLPAYPLYTKIFAASLKKSPSPSKTSRSSYRAISQDSTGCQTTLSSRQKSRFSELCKIKSQIDLRPKSKTHRNRLKSIDLILTECEIEKTASLKPCLMQSIKLFRKLEDELKQSANMHYEEMMDRKRKR